MIRSYLKIAFRNILKYRGYSLINILGLAIGLACFTLIVLFVRDELSYDKYHPKADRTWRLVLDANIMGSELHAPITPAPMAAVLVEEIPEIEIATRLQPFSGETQIRYGEKGFVEKRFMLVDSNITEVFAINFLQGDPKKALTAPNSLVLTESTAKRYFGEEDPLGATLIVGDTARFQVTGVTNDPPHNTHFHYDILASMSTLPDSRNTIWISNNYMTYVVLKENTTPEMVEAKLPALFKKYAGPQIKMAMGVDIDQFIEAGNKFHYNLQSMPGIHLNSNMEYEIAPNSNIAYIYIFMVVAAFLILIACINFMNLSTARSARRAKEVGMRKVMGSNRLHLVFQFLSESIFITFVALGLALILIELALPYFNQLADKQIDFQYFDGNLIIPGFMLLGLLVGIIAGSYPALFLSAFQPVSVLKGKLKAGGRSTVLRNGLVIFQFTLSIILIVGTVVVYNQLQYMQNKRLGFEKEHVLVIQRAGSLQNQQKSFAEALRQHSGIVNVTATSNIPGGIIGNTAYQPGNSSGGEGTLLMSPIFTDEAYIPTLDIEIIAGRNFSADMKTDSTAFIINEAAAERLGWQEDAIDKDLVMIGQTPENNFNGRIIGVMKDIHFQSLHQEITPLVLSYTNFQTNFLLVRLQSGNISETIDFIASEWKSFAPNQLFSYQFLDESLDALYRSEKRLSEIFTIFAVLSVLIACLGLFGLASFIAEQRTKEIGVRKALGATVPMIVNLLLKDFILLIAIAFIIAAPIAYFSAGSWLQDFAYRIDVSFLTIGLSGILALLIAVLTIGYQAIKAALTNPINALRHE